MKKTNEDRRKILITDDSALNRELLAEMLREEFDIVEACDGEEALQILQNQMPEISLVLLDIVMPKMDGFEVLAFMNKYHWIDEIPVIMISAESSSIYIERAYELGVSDFISRPFDGLIVHRRVVNTIMLYAKQKRLMRLVADQIYEKEKSNSMMVTILSHIVEFRNGESGMHVLHINALTEIFLQCLVKKTNRYELSQADILLISTASALHDIGKISVPYHILNKPGRLTAQEFEVIKGHSIYGAQMLENLPMYRDEPLVKVAYEICRWHHERYDGNGYPDGLSGDEIPIAAQIVSLADVYDALTSERCYKEAISHEKAMQMILNGQCGAFNPLLLECLVESAEKIREEIQYASANSRSIKEIQNLANEMLERKELTSTDQTMQLLECERKRSQFLLLTSDELMFSYLCMPNTPAVLVISPQMAKLLEMEEYMFEPCQDKRFKDIFGEENLEKLIKWMHATSEKEPDFQMDGKLMIHGEPRWYHFRCHAIWMAGKAQAVVQGMVGKLTDAQHVIDFAQYKGESAAEDALQSALDVFDPEKSKGGLTLSMDELHTMMKHLKQVFHIVRIVDAEITTQYMIEEDGSFVEMPYRCYAVWNKTKRCANCISVNVMQTKKRLEKFEFVGDDVYYVVAVYVKVDRAVYVLEMVSKITNETLFDGSGNKKLIEAITEHNRNIYEDTVTGVYNRRYFDEQLCDQAEQYAVALVDVDNFKHINDSYGHHAGDLALRAIADEIKRSIRKSDVAVRYSGDEFAIVFGELTQDTFRFRMEEIRERVRSIRLEEYPDIRLSISAGGAYHLGVVAELSKEAAQLLYQAKEKKDSIELSTK